jgi:hypothetical protein
MGREPKTARPGAPQEQGKLGEYVGAICEISALGWL